MKTLNITFLILLALLFTGCFSTNNSTYTKKSININTLYTQDTYNNINISQALLDHFKEWEGTPYKYAGNTKKGVDCSYFVQNAYIQSLNIKLPRTTKYQSKQGQEVNKHRLKTGDLVFFITGHKKRHVGIYLNNGHFMHASTSKGVIISRLDNPYWSKHYWKTQRIIK